MTRSVVNLVTSTAGIGMPFTIGVGVTSGTPATLGSLIQKSVWIIGIGWPLMIQPKLPSEKSAAPPSDVICDLLVYTDPPSDHSKSFRLNTDALALNSNPLLFMAPTFFNCELRKPSEGI